MSARPCQQLPDAQTHASLPWALTSLGEGGADARRPGSAPSSSLHLAGRPRVLVASGHTCSQLGSYLTCHHRSLRISSRFPPGLGRGRVAPAPKPSSGFHAYQERSPSQLSPRPSKTLPSTPLAAPLLGRSAGPLFQGPAECRFPQEALRTSQSAGVSVSTHPPTPGVFSCTWRLSTPPLFPGR